MERVFNRVKLTTKCLTLPNSCEEDDKQTAIQVIIEEQGGQAAGEKHLKMCLPALCPLIETSAALLTLDS